MKDSKNFKNENIENIIKKIYMSIIQMNVWKKLRRK